MFENKTLLITGGTGSFGNAVLKKFLNTNIKEIRIFSRDEKKQDDLRKSVYNNKVNFYIGDVRDRDSLIPAIKGVDYIFHAAALKQVPSCEFFPMQAVKTNVEGTQNVIRAAVHHKIKKVICLSTDKAANAIAGAVFLPTGSIILCAILTPNSSACCSAKSNWDSLVINI